MGIGKHSQHRRAGTSGAGRKLGSVGRASLALTAAGCAFLLASPAIASTAPTSAITAKAASAARTSFNFKTVVFSGHYHGDASLLINNGSVTISSVAGKGTGTILGASTVVGKGSSSASAQCDPFTGKGSLTGSKGKIDLTVTESKSSGCSSGESGPITVTFQGVAVATGGTGTASGATGSLNFKGKLSLANTSGTQNGPYTVTLSGKLKVKG
jgi:hypothetical protein